MARRFGGGGGLGGEIFKKAGLPARWEECPRRNFKWGKRELGFKKEKNGGGKAKKVGTGGGGLVLSLDHDLGMNCDLGRKKKKKAGTLGQGRVAGVLGGGPGEGGGMGVGGI